MACPFFVGSLPDAAPLGLRRDDGRLRRVILLISVLRLHGRVRETLRRSARLSKAPYGGRMKLFRCALTLALLCSMAMTQATAADTPEFRVDPFWPKPLPNSWIMGQIGGIATDRHDHAWVFQRPRTLTDD